MKNTTPSTLRDAQLLRRELVRIDKIIQELEESPTTRTHRYRFTVGAAHNTLRALRRMIFRDLLREEREGLERIGSIQERSII